MLYRIGLVLLLLLLSLPASAEDVPYEVTVNEAIEDSTYEEGLTVSGGNSDVYIYCNEQNQYGTTGCSLAIQSGTYVFEFSEDVYEVGFIVGAVNNSYDVKYYYSDGTDETIQKSGQDNSDFLLCTIVFINHLLTTTMMKLTQINLLQSLKLHYLIYRIRYTILAVC